MNRNLTDMLIMGLLIITILAVAYGVNRIGTEGAQCIVDPLEYYAELNNVSLNVRTSPGSFFYDNPSLEVDVIANNDSSLSIEPHSQ